MNWLIAFALLATPLPEDPITATAVEYGAPSHLVAAFAELEQEFDVPEEFRGLLLAKAWRESRYNPNAEGDWHVYDMTTKKLVKCKRGQPGCVPMAVGCIQMWPWSEKRGLDRRDCVAAARFYLAHIRRTMPKVTKLCRTKTDRAAWLVAQIRINRGPKYRGGPWKGMTRCAGTPPKSIRIIKRWRTQRAVRVATRR